MRLWDLWSLSDLIPGNAVECLITNNCASDQVVYPDSRVEVVCSG